MISNVVKRVEGERPWITYPKNRIRDNQNFLGIATGGPGSGKTYFTIAYAEKIDPNFKVEEGLVFNFEGAMKLINSEEFHKREWKIILWDEPQIEMSNRNWQSVANKLINYLLSTFRSQNVILLWASPYKDFLDSQSMKLVHAEFQCKGWDKSTKLTKVRPRLLQYNSDFKKTYPHKLYSRTSSGNLEGIDLWSVPLASARNINKYEEMKSDFNKNLNRSIEKDLLAMKSSKKGGDKTSESIEINDLFEKYGENYFEIQKLIPNKSLSTIYKLHALYKKANRAALATGQAPTI